MRPMPLLMALGLLPLFGAAPAFAGRSIDDAGRAEFEEIFRRVSSVSPYRDKARLLFFYFPFNERTLDIDGTWVEGVPKRRGQSPASATAPGEAENPTGKPIITVTDYIFHYARDHDEAAFIIAHELSHLQLSHVEGYTQDFCDVYRRLYGQNVPCQGGTKPERARVDRDAPAEAGRLDGILRRNEYSADANALEQLTSAGYDPRAAGSLLRWMAELHRKHNFKPSAVHPPPMDRLAVLQARIDQLAAPRGP